MGDAVSRPEEESHGVRRLPSRLAITGLGIDTSIGEAIVQKLLGTRRSSLECIMINNGDEKQKMDRVERYCKRYNANYGDILRPATLDEICTIRDDKHPDANPADVVLFTAGLGLGAARGNFTTEMPPDIRRFLFNLNIGMIKYMARKFAAYGNDAQRYMIFTNPCDTMGFYFAREFWDERVRKHYKGERAGRFSPEPFRNSISAFNNADSSRAHIIVSENLDEKFKGEPYHLQVRVVGPHDGRLVLASSLSTVTYREGKKTVTKSLDHFLDPGKLDEIQKMTARFAWEELNDMGSASLSVAESFVEVYDAMCNGVSEVELSIPYSFRGRDMFIGLRARFDPELYVVVSDKFMQAFDIDSVLDARPGDRDRDITVDQANFITSASSISYELNYLDERRSSLTDDFSAQDINTDIAQDPKFFAELAVPVRIKEGGASKEWLFFHNCTEPHSDFRCVRNPVLLHDHPTYIESIVKDDKRLLAVCNLSGIEIIDPKGRDRPKQLDLPNGSKKRHVNGCCLAGDLYVASTNDGGLFWSDGENLEEMTIIGDFPDRFIGNVKSIGDMLYFSTSTAVVEAELIGNTAKVKRYFPVPDEQEVHNFCVYTTINGNEVLISTGPSQRKDGQGVVHRFGVDGIGKKLFDNNNENNLPDLRFVEVAYVFDKMHAVIRSHQGVAWMPLSGEGQGGRALINDSRYYVTDMATSAFGGIFMLAVIKGRGRNYDANRVYHVCDPDYLESDVPRIHLSPLCDNYKISETMTIYEEFVPLKTGK